MGIDETIQSPNQSSRGGHRPELIVMHIADGTYEGTKAWFRSSASETSSHFVVARDGRVCQCVPLERMAWCNGTSTDSSSTKHFSHSSVELVRSLGGNANWYSVSIECEGFYSQTAGALTDPQLESVAWLIGHIRGAVRQTWGHTIPLDRRYLVGHCEVTPKTRPHCPGEQFPWPALLRRLGADIAGTVLYRIQVGAFRSRENAETFRLSQVLPKGIGAFVTPEGTDGIFRVQVGAFSQRSNAEAYLRQVRDQGLEAFLTLESGSV